MCFTTKDQQGKAIPAPSDITAFKVLQVQHGMIKSPIRGNRWTQGRMKIAPRFESEASWNSINRGIHCFKSITNAQVGFHKTKSATSDEKIFIVTIPKGTLVHINDTQYCAERVKLEMFRPLTIIKPVLGKKVKKKK